MARILVATSPLHGHVQSEVLLVKTLIERGNEVVWYTGKRFKGPVEATGATHVGMEAFDYDDRELEAAFPDRRNHEGLDKLKFDLKHVFMDGMPSYHEEMRRILETFSAEVVVSDLSFFGVLPMMLTGEPKGLKFAGTSSIPLGFSGPDVPPFGLGLPVPSTEDERAQNIGLHNHFQNEVFADVQAHLNSSLTEHGYPSTDIYWGDGAVLHNDLFLQFTIPSFEYSRSNLPNHVRFVGPMIEKGQEVNAADLPDWWHELDGKRPVVHVTQGTLDINDYQRLIQPTIQALADEDVLVVVATGGRPTSDIGVDLPDNVRVAEYLPYEQFLPRVDVMVTNGGYGGVQYALSNGVPLVVAGDTEDKPEVCQRVAWSGAGISLGTGTPTSEQVHEAVKDVLEKEQYRMRAKALQEEYAQHDAATESARLLEELAADKGNKR